MLKYFSFFIFYFFKGGLILIGKLLMTNFNRELKLLLPETLQEQINKVFKKKRKPDEMKDTETMVDLLLPRNEMTGGDVITELQLLGEERLANSLLSWLMIYEAQQRHYNMT